MRNFPLPVIRRLVPIKSLHEHSLQALLETSELVLVGRGLPLFSMADYTKHHYYILTGEADLVFAKGVARHTPEVIYPVGYAMPGLQSATAHTDCLCLKVGKSVLDSQLCWDHVASAIELDLSYRPEHDSDAGWRLTMLRSNLFVKVPPLNVDQIFSRLKPMQVRAGDVILKQGDPGDSCYFIRRGMATVTRRQPDEEQERHLVNIGHGRCFGEDALIHETVRNATVSMLTDGFLLRLDKPDFMVLLREPEPTHIKAADLERTLTSGAVMLDVRTEDEYRVSRLQVADSVPLACLRFVVSTHLDKQKEYITCCDTGRRSRAAANLLQKLGFRSSYLLNGIQSLSETQREQWHESAPPLMPVAVSMPMTA